MIRTPTTFIVGAGGSAPYGLPVGTELHRRAKALDEGQFAHKLLAECGGQGGEFKALLEDLREHPAESIDAFLESRQESKNTLAAGKLLIAALMADALELSRPAPGRESDWLGYVIEKMRKGAPTWDAFVKGNHRVRFITFNFDTLIEERLGTAIRAIYRGHAIDDNAILAAIPVIHVHGKLPARRGSLQPPGQASGWPSKAATSWVTKASREINVVLDQIDPVTVNASLDAITQAAIVCFLGFAYDPDNLEHIGLPNAFGSMKKIPEVFGSAFGLLPGECAGVHRQFLNKIELGGPGQGCREVLRALNIFRE